MKKFWKLFYRRRMNDSLLSGELFAVFREGDGYAHKYWSLTEATEDAKKLAAEKIDQEYIVMEAIAYVKANAPSVSVQQARHQDEERRDASLVAMSAHREQ